MKKFLLALTIMGSGLVNAQSVDSYIFKVETEKPYTPLITGTNITSGLVWDDLLSFKIPIGFTADIGGKLTSDFCVLWGNRWVAASDTADLGKVINTFAPFEMAPLIDRGTLTGISQSPLRYIVTGTTPNRIFKYEVFNAGFWFENYSYGTLNDSVNFQVWLYETSNIVEIRFGDSKITHPEDYYNIGIAPYVGYFKEIDFDKETISKRYYLTGNPTTPIVDSLDFHEYTGGLGSCPPSGTVYRFIPKAVAASIGESSFAQQFNVYPTVTKETLTVDYNFNTKTKVDIYSASGQIVKSSIIQKGSNALDVSTLASGTYLLQLSNNDGKAAFKFMKQ